MSVLRWPKGSRGLVFWIQIVYLVVIAAIAWMAFTDSDLLPSELKDPTEGLGGLAPPGVLLFGALGGVLISLSGVFEHRYDWDDRYFYWYLARPLVGASVALVAALIVRAGILAIGVDVNNLEEAKARYILYVMGFVVGYREESFRGLVKKAADLLFTSTGEGSAPVVSSIDPDHGPVGGDGDKVTIAGSGLTGTTVVRFGPAKADFLVISDGEIKATVPQGDAAGRVPVLLVTPRGAAVAVQLYEYQ